MSKTIHLGYEIGNGAAVEIPLRHTVVTGQTQLAGKTTALEAMISRSGLRAVAFITKRAEGGFHEKITLQTIPPFFREKSDWIFVSSILGAILKEKLKFQRSWIMEICRATKTLAEVQENVRHKLETSKRGLDRSVYTELDEYLKLVIPQIRRLPYVSHLHLDDGLNVMDLSAYTTELQMLVISSVLERVYEAETGVITIIPEAWEFIPRSRSSPVLHACESLIRKGGAAGNFVWLDSQDIVGVSADIRKSIGVYILGVQRERNEVIRTLNHMTATVKPKPAEIMSLALGEFFVCYGNTMKRVYVQPAWMDEDEARKIARGDAPFLEPHTARRAMHRETHEVVLGNKVLYPLDARAVKEFQGFYGNNTGVPEGVEDVGRIQELEKEIAELRARLAKYEGGEDAETTGDPRNLRVAKFVSERPPQAESLDYDNIYNHVMDRARRDPVLLKVLVAKPGIEVEVQHKTVKADGASLRGRIALLLHEGFLDDGGTAYKVHTELIRRGKDPGKANVYREFKDFFHKEGFVTREGEGVYKIVPGMKINIKR